MNFWLTFDLISTFLYCSEQNHSITSEPYRTEFSTILLATYTSITAQTLSVTTVHNVLNPSLQKLLNDITELVPGLSENVRSIMSKLEDVYGVKNLGVSVSNSISNPVQDMAIATSNSGVAAKISQSPSLDEMKQKMMGMGKLFNRQSNNSNGGENNSGNSSSSPFWKKS